MCFEHLQLVVPVLGSLLPYCFSKRSTMKRRACMFMHGGRGIDVLFLKIVARDFLHVMSCHTKGCFTRFTILC